MFGPLFTLQRQSTVQANLQLSLLSSCPHWHTLLKLLQHSNLMLTAGPRPATPPPPLNALTRLPRVLQRHQPHTPQNSHKRSPTVPPSLHTMPLQFESKGRGAQLPPQVLCYLSSLQPHTDNTQQQHHPHAIEMPHPRCPCRVEKVEEKRGDGGVC